MTISEDKRSKFLAEYEVQRKKKQKKILLITGLLVVLVLAGYSIYSKINTIAHQDENYNIGQPVSYQGKKVEMTSINTNVIDGKLEIPISAVKENSIIYTEYRGYKRNYYGKLDYLPLMAVVSPSGWVQVSTSICEPCYSTKFYIEGDDLVCVSCGTHWRLSDLMGLFGGCVKYPPEAVPYKVEGDKLLIEEKFLKEWEPRAFKPQEGFEQ